MGILLAGNAELAAGACIPGQLREEFRHGAEVGKAGECKAEADESREIEPVWIQRDGESHADEDKEAGAQADLAFERPACFHVGDNRQAAGDQGVGAAIEDDGSCRA